MNKPPALFKRTVTGFQPCNDEGLAIWQSVALHQTVKLEIKQPRNIRRLRLWWGAMSAAADNLDGPWTKELVHQAVMEELGEGHIVQDRRGKQRFAAKSISFGAMSETEFREILDRALDVLSRALGVPVETLFAEVEAAA